MRDRSIRTGLAIAILVTFGAAMWCGFVFDDRHQILHDPYVQHGRYLLHGLLSDVWSFTGDGSTWSNYWRPGFVLWNFLNWQAFGNTPALWHLVNVGLHIVAVLLAFNLLLRLQFSTMVAGLAAVIFALHPTRTESVTWVAGSTDVLATICLLAGLHRYLTWRTSGRALDMILAAAGYLGALLCKEVSIATLLLIPVIATTLGSRFRESLRQTIPFATAAVAFLVARYFVLGFITNPPTHAVTWTQNLLTLPKVLVFYVTQSLWPTRMGVVHDLTLSTPADLTTLGWWIQAIAALAVVGGAIWTSFRFKTLRLAISLYFFPLLPALSLRVFRPDDLVHERYLYLPMLGFGLFVSVILFELAPRIPVAWRPRIGGALGGAYAISTFLFNPAWISDVTLWKTTAENCPNSPRAWTELASAYQQDHHPVEAERSVERALALAPPLNNTLTIYGMAAKDLGRLDVAKQRLEQAVKVHPEFAVGWDQLAIVYQLLGDPAAAIDTYRRGQKAVAYRSDLYAVNIALELSKTGRTHDAIAELEPRRHRMMSSRDAAVVGGLYYLGILESDVGQGGESKSDLQAFLRSAGGFGDSKTLSLMKEARQRLRSAG